MIQGLYAAANGMMSVEDRQAVIANNIANVSTNGFKRQLMVQKGFYGEYLDSNNAARLNITVAPGGGIKTSETFTHFGGGGLSQTGNPLDVALIGEGFFHLRGPDGDVYSRSGKFDISADGILISPNGSPVLDITGSDIDVSGGMPVFDATGTVYVNGEERGQLAIIEFEDPHGLIRTGENLFVATDEIAGTGFQAQGTTVAAQSIEASNVQLPVEMINMMMALRAYSANQKVIQTIDETTGRMVDQVGSPS